MRITTWGTRTTVFMRDEDALNYARRSNEVFKTKAIVRHLLNTVVKGFSVGQSFIRPDTQEIYISRPRVARAVGWKTPFLSVFYDGTLVHENYHVVGPPFGPFAELYNRYIGELALIATGGRLIIGTRLTDITNIIDDTVIDTMILVWNDAYSRQRVAVLTKYGKFNKTLLKEPDIDPATALLIYKMNFLPGLYYGKRPERDTPLSKYGADMTEFIYSIISSTDPDEYIAEYNSGKLAKVLVRLTDTVLRSTYLYLKYLERAVNKYGVFTPYKDFIMEASKLIEENVGIKEDVPDDPAEILETLKALAPESSLEKVVWLALSMIIAHALIENNAMYYAKVLLDTAKNEAGKIEQKALLKGKRGHPGREIPEKKQKHGKQGEGTCSACRRGEQGKEKRTGDGNREGKKKDGKSGKGSIGNKEKKKGDEKTGEGEAKQKGENKEGKGGSGKGKRDRDKEESEERKKAEEGKRVQPVPRKSGGSPGYSPGTGVLKKLLRGLSHILGEGGELLRPEVAGEVAEKLLKRAFVYAGTKVRYKTKVGSVTLPFLATGGSGTPIETTFESPVPTEWMVQLVYVTGEEKFEVPLADPPEFMTIVIDTSGSTAAETPVLAPLALRPTTVADAERVIALAFLKTLKKMRATTTKINLLKFSSTVQRAELSVDEAEEELQRKASSWSWYEMGGTAIINAVQEAVRTHRDGPKNPFILLTDLEVPLEVANKIYDIMVAKIPKSPKLIVIVTSGPVTLGKLAKLNEERNAAVVVLSGASDYVLLERAIRKVSAKVFT